MSFSTTSGVVNGGTIAMRPYQHSAIEAVHTALREGHSSFLLSLATGLGKTVIFAEIIRRLIGKNLRVFVLAHRNELIYQAVDKIERATGITPGVEMGAQRAGERDLIVVASVATLARGRRIAGPLPALVIIDEAHHAVAKSYQTAFEGFGAERFLLGGTATAFRHDGKPLLSIFECEAFSYGLLDGIKDGWLCDVRVIGLPVKIDLRNVKTSNGDFAAGGVAKALDPSLSELADIVARDYSGRKLLAFLPTCALSKAWAGALRARGLSAAHVQGTSKNRGAILDYFASDKLRFLSNSNLLIEGYDEPSIDCVLMLRPTQSHSLYAQMVGRGTRFHQGKTELLLLDPMFESEKHAPASFGSSLLGEDPRSRRIIRLVASGLSFAKAANQEEAEHTAWLEHLRAERSERFSPDDPEREPREFDSDGAPGTYKREGYSKSLAELVEEWKPTKAWHHHPVTALQLRKLARLGADLSEVDCKGRASYMIDQLQKRGVEPKATQNQRALMWKLGGYHATENMTQAEASNWIEAAPKPSWWRKRVS